MGFGLCILLCIWFQAVYGGQLQVQLPGTARCCHTLGTATHSQDRQYASQLPTAAVRASTICAMRLSSAGRSCLARVKAVELRWLRAHKRTRIAAV